MKNDLVINVSVSLKCLFLLVFSLRKWLAHFLFIQSNGEAHRKKTLFESEKRRYLPHFWTYEGFKGIFANRGLRFFHVGSLEILLAAPLR